MYKEKYCLTANIDLSTLSYHFDRTENGEYLATTIWVDDNDLPVGGNDVLLFFTEGYILSNFDKFIGDLYFENNMINMNISIGNIKLRNE